MLNNNLLTGNIGCRKRLSIECGAFLPLCSVLSHKFNKPCLNQRTQCRFERSVSQDLSHFRRVIEFAIPLTIDCRDRFESKNYSVSAETMFGHQADGINDIRQINAGIAEQ